MRNYSILFLQSIASILKVVLLSKFKNILFKSTQVNEKSIVILGNGPSLNNTIEKYSSQLKTNELLCVNNFVLTDHFLEFKPKYYVIVAPILFLPEDKLPQNYLEIRDNCFKAIYAKTTWSMNLMLPFVAKKSSFIKNLAAKNPNVKLSYFNTTPIEGFSTISHFFYMRGLGMPRPHNVLIPSIMNSIFLGFKQVYIVGADHSWLNEITVNSKNEALVNQKHFYDENESKPEVMADYITRPRRLHEMIYKFYLSFRGYWDILEYSKSKNVKIYNASEHSMIDAFERKKLSN